MQPYGFSLLVKFLRKEIGKISTSLSEKCFCHLVFVVVVLFVSWLSHYLFGCSDDENLYQEDDLELETGFGNIIIIDNLPVVPREKFEKLEGVIRKIYGQIGVIKEDGLWMPVDPETQKTLGYCFIEYNTVQVLIIIYLSLLSPI